MKPVHIGIPRKRWMEDIRTVARKKWMRLAKARKMETIRKGLHAGMDGSDLMKRRKS